jgi:hypothetical protein
MSRNRHDGHTLAAEFVNVVVGKGSICPAPHTAVVKQSFIHFRLTQGTIERSNAVVMKAKGKRLRHIRFDEWSVTFHASQLSLSYTLTRSIT